MDLTQALSDLMTQLWVSIHHTRPNHLGDLARGLLLPSSAVGGPDKKRGLSSSLSGTISSCSQWQIRSVYKWYEIKGSVLSHGSIAQSHLRSQPGSGDTLRQVLVNMSCLGRAGEEGLEKHQMRRRGLHSKTTVTTHPHLEPSELICRRAKARRKIGMYGATELTWNFWGMTLLNFQGCCSWQKIAPIY
jgi:hypothetical protein